MSASTVLLAVKSSRHRATLDHSRRASQLEPDRSFNSSWRALHLALRRNLRDFRGRWQESRKLKSEVSAPALILYGTFPSVRLPSCRAYLVRPTGHLLRNQSRLAQLLFAYAWSKSWMCPISEHR